MSGLASRLLGRREAGAAAPARAAAVEAQSLPRAVDTGHAHRRTSWNERAWAVAFFASVVLNIVQGNAISMMIPLQRWEPWFLTAVPETDLVVEAKPLRAVVNGQDVLTERMVRAWVAIAHSVVLDSQEMQRRVGRQGWIQQRSSEPVYGDYLRQHQARVRRMMEGRQRAQVRLIASGAIQPWYYQVDFEVTDLGDDNRVLQQRRYRAFLRVAYQEEVRSIPVEWRYDERFDPTGFRVVSYGVELLN